jgi:hypothetical protein
MRVAIQVAFLTLLYPPFWGVRASTKSEMFIPYTVTSAVGNKLPWFVSELLAR